MPGVKLLVVGPDPRARALTALALRGLEGRLGEPLEVLEAADGLRGVEVARRERPDVVVADEIASRAGAFHLAWDLRGAAEPFRGVIVVLLERRQDAWLACRSGADAWFVKPVDPFQLAEGVAELVEARTATEAPA